MVRRVCLRRKICAFLFSVRWLPTPILEAILTLVVIFADPFGLSSATDARSRDTAYQITAPFYPSDVQDQISVVLIDDHSLETTIPPVNGAQGGNAHHYFNWPPTFAQYDDLLNTIALYHPKAIFFDLLFLDQRGSRDDLELFAQDIANLDIPVFAMGTDIAQANTSTCRQSQKPVLPELSKSFTGLPFYKYSGFGDNYALYSHCGDKVLKSPAAMLFEELCRTGYPYCPSSLPANSAGIEKALGDTLSLRWGERTAPINERIYPKSFEGPNPQCETGDNSFFDKVKHTARYFLGALLQIAAPEPSRCLYHPHIPAANLMKHQAQLTHLAPPEQQALSRNILQSLIEDKIVMIGMDLAGIRDTVVSPVQGTVPGVMAHAMALDNLLALGDASHRPPPALWWHSDYSSLFELLGLVCLFAMRFRVTNKAQTMIFIRSIIRWRKSSETSTGSGDPETIDPVSRKKTRTRCQIIRDFAVITILFSALTFGLIAMMFGCLHWTPINWTGLLALGWGYAAFWYVRTWQTHNKDDNAENGEDYGRKSISATEQVTRKGGQ